MCGIMCLLYNPSSSIQEQLATKVKRSIYKGHPLILPTQVIKCLEGQLKRRGHDSVQQIKLHLPSDMILVVIGCVLSLRGKTTPQPTNEGWSWLLWNGEVFDGLVVSAGKIN